MIEQIAVIGLGLMGGSFAQAVKKNRLCQQLTAFDKNSEILELAQKWGMIESPSDTIADAVKNADLIVIATPMSHLKTVFTDIAPHLKPSAVITDLGSSKVAAIEAAKQALGKHFHHYVPGHPITGSNRHGIRAAEQDLFKNRPVLLTPLNETDENAGRCQ